SGGGFRASLYHLGLVRFLRDAGLLSQVSHITAVSGGSIIAAHLVLNWDRYNGSPGEFDAAASELLAFVRLDVRNRIVRRFLLTLPVRWPRRLLGRSNRKLTRTGLLEYHYEKYLYGDTSLFELPEKPQLDLQAVVKALQEASAASAETPLRRLAQVLVAARSRPEPLALTSGRTASAAGFRTGAGPGEAGGPPPPPPSSGSGNGDTEELVVAGLWEVMRHYQFHRDPLFAGLKPADADAELLLHASRGGGRVLDAGDQLWLNRHL